MPALTCASMLPWSPSPWNRSPRQGRPIQAAQWLADRQQSQTLATLQAQPQSQDRAKSLALWEVMMRPA